MSKSINIETDKYLITSNESNIIVQMKEVVEDSKMLKDKSKIGSIGLGKKRYYPTLEIAYGGIVNQLIRDSNAQHFDDIKMLIRELIDEVRFLQC